MNNLKKELKSLDMYVEKIEDRVIKSRILHLLDWYIRKANFYRNIFYVMSVSLIVINAIIPVIIQMSLVEKDIIVSIISSLATVISGVLTLFTMKDTWGRYREYAELIKEECMKYNCCFGEYKDNQNQYLLGSNIELIIANERALWKSKFGEKDVDRSESN